MWTQSRHFCLSSPSPTSWTRARNPTSSRVCELKEFLLGNIPWMSFLGMRFENIKSFSMHYLYWKRFFVLCDSVWNFPIGFVKMGNASGTKANPTFNTFSNGSLTGIIVSSSSSVCLWIERILTIETKQCWSESTLDWKMGSLQVLTWHCQNMFAVASCFPIFLKNCNMKIWFLRITSLWQCGWVTVVWECLYSIIKCFACFGVFDELFPKECT